MTEAGMVSDRRQYNLLLEPEADGDGYKATRIKKDGTKGERTAHGGTPSEAVDNFIKEYHNGGDYVVNVVTEEEREMAKDRDEKKADEKVVSADKKADQRERSVESQESRERHRTEEVHRRAREEAEARTEKEHIAAEDMGPKTEKDLPENPTKAEAGSNPHPERSAGGFGAGEGNTGRAPGGVGPAANAVTEEAATATMPSTRDVAPPGEGRGPTPGEVAARDAQARASAGEVNDSGLRSMGVVGRDYPLEARRTESLRAMDKEAPPEDDNEIVIIAISQYKKVSRRDIRLWKASGSTDANAIPGDVVSTFEEVAVVGKKEPRNG